MVAALWFGGVDALVARRCAPIPMPMPRWPPLRQADEMVAVADAGHSPPPA
jgi:hypothetical protein